MKRRLLHNLSRRCRLTGGSVEPYTLLLFTPYGGTRSDPMKELTLFAGGLTVALYCIWTWSSSIHPARAQALPSQTGARWQWYSLRLLGIVFIGGGAMEQVLLLSDWWVIRSPLGLAFMLAGGWSISIADQLRSIESALLGTKSLVNNVE